MSTAALAPGRPLERALGSYDVGTPGPTLLVCAGIHGNEPAGVHAVRRVLAKLQELALPLRGRIAAVAGNLAALRQGARYLARDLNRGWGADKLEALTRRERGGDSPEDTEQRALLAEFEQAERQRRGPLLFVDLHTSSGDSPPFTATGDTLPNRGLAMALPLPLILGLEETIEGAALEWFNVRGHAALAVEGGRHDAPATVDNHEACLWLLLVAAGMLDAAQVPGLPRYRAHLEAAAQGAPKVVEITYRHVVRPADVFRMAPGFASFQPISKGQKLGDSAAGEVRAHVAGRILLPLYQAQGDDGYFLGRDVRRFWLHVARWLRTLRFDCVLGLLPGVRCGKGDPNTMFANRKVARWFLVEIFHLLGFRKERAQGDVLVFSRRFANAEAQSLLRRR